MIWTGKRVAELIKQPPMVGINPNGVDLRVIEVFRIDENSTSVLKGKQRNVTQNKIEPDEEGFYNLERGLYSVRIANEVSIPRDAVGKLFPRSSLNRLGMIKSETAIWDPGYTGFGTQTVFIGIKKFRIHKDEFWFQFTLEDAEVSDKQYDGHWQGEKPTE
jgi:deoxycytidine triphosphate deaminase